MTPEEATTGRFVFCLTCGEVLESEDLPAEDLTLDLALSPAHAVAYERFVEQHRGHRVAFSIQPEGLEYWLRVTIGANDMSDKLTKHELYYRIRLRTAVMELLLVLDPDMPTGPEINQYGPLLKYASDRLAAEAAASESSGAEENEVCGLSACGGTVAAATRVWSAVDGVFCSDAHYQQFREAKLTGSTSSEELPALGLPVD